MNPFFRIENKKFIKIELEEFPEDWSTKKKADRFLNELSRVNELRYVPSNNGSSTETNSLENEPISYEIQSDIDLNQQYFVEKKIPIPQDKEIFTLNLIDYFESGCYSGRELYEINYDAVVYKISEQDHHDMSKFITKIRQLVKNPNYSLMRDAKGNLLRLIEDMAALTSNTNSTIYQLILAISYYFIEDYCKAFCYLRKAKMVNTRVSKVPLYDSIIDKFLLDVHRNIDGSHTFSLNFENPREERVKICLIGCMNRVNSREYYRQDDIYNVIQDIEFYAPGSMIGVPKVTYIPSEIFPSFDGLVSRIPRDAQFVIFYFHYDDDGNTLKVSLDGQDGITLEEFEEGLKKYENKNNATLILLGCDGTDFGVNKIFSRHIYSEGRWSARTIIPFVFSFFKGQFKYINGKRHFDRAQIFTSFFSKESEWIKYIDWSQVE